MLKNRPDDAKFVCARGVVVGGTETTSMSRRRDISSRFKDSADTQRTPLSALPVFPWGMGRIICHKGGATIGDENTGCQAK